MAVLCRLSYSSAVRILPTTRMAPSLPVDLWDHRRVRAPTLILLLAAIVAGGCSTDPPADPPTSSPQTVPAEELARLEVATEADTLSFEVEVADEPDEMTRGLMDRPTMAEGTGMVFLYEEPTAGSFWMKNTLIPLTIAFWDESGTIVAIRDMEPCAEDPCPLYGPGADYVGALEVNQGELEGAAPGDTVELTPSQVRP